jgi:hypothetical protein
VTRREGIDDDEPAEKQRDEEERIERLQTTSPLPQ